MTKSHFVKNPSCQHYHVENETWQCKECGEKMIGRSDQAKTVKSAPNLVPGSGMYIPDVANEREVILYYEVSYVCERCLNEGTTITGEGISWSCGLIHRGKEIEVR